MDKELSQDVKDRLDNIIDLYSSNYALIRRSLLNCKKQLNSNYVNETYIKNIERQINFWVSRLNSIREDEKRTIENFCTTNNVDINIVTKYIKNKNNNGNI